MDNLYVYQFRRLVEIEFTQVKWKYLSKIIPWLDKEVEKRTKEYVSLSKYRVDVKKDLNEMRDRVVFSETVTEDDKSVLINLKWSDRSCSDIKIVGHSFDVILPDLTIDKCKDLLDYKQYLLLINSYSESELVGNE